MNAQPEQSRTFSFERVAIVNRGEAAVRFIRALRDYNRERGTRIEAVAFYTDTDRGAPFTRLADLAIPIGPAMRPGAAGPISAYTDLPHILTAITSARCDAVWPGWGFVAENAEFVTLLESRGIVFIGPSSHAMRQLGDKIAAKSIAQVSAVPMADWHLIAADEPFEVTREAAARVGVPLVVKAAAGGGGRGIRVVRDLAELRPAMSAVADEVRRSFGGGGMFLEACVGDARHIEVQLVVGADGVGRALGVRDCSIQRKHQKVIEEAPSPVLSDTMSQTLQEAAIRLGEAVGYRGVGTVEFLVDPRREFAHFLEVNTRLQVEHTVTECVTGLDLVQIQLDIAQGLPWEHFQPPTASTGHAIEVRLNAEDPERGFMPSPGIIRVFRPPLGPGLRVDSGVAEGVAIAPEFDSMIAKIIAHGRDRRQAIARLVRALRELELVVEDGTSNKHFLLELLHHPAVLDATADTGWLDRQSSANITENESLNSGIFEALCTAAIVARQQVIAQAIAGFHEDVQGGIPWPLRVAPREGIELSSRGDDFTFEAHLIGRDRFLVGPKGARFEVGIEHRGPQSASLELATTEGSRKFDVLYARGRQGFVIDVDGRSHRVDLASGGRISAPAPALVIAIHVQNGAEVEVGERLATLEAMKMEVPVFARERGRIGEVLCRTHEQVQAGQALFRMERRADRHALETRGSRLSLPVSQTPPAPIDLHTLDRLPIELAHPIIARHLDTLRAFILGWEVPPERLDDVIRLLDDEDAFRSLADPSRWRPLAELIASFADIEQCFEQHLEDPDMRGMIRAEALFFQACRASRGEGLPSHPAFEAALSRALRHYGVGSTDSSPGLDAALYRMAVAHAEGRRHDLINQVLRALISLGSAGVRFDERELELQLARCAEVARSDKPMLRDNARQARYLLFRRERQTRGAADLPLAAQLSRLVSSDSRKLENRDETLENRDETLEYQTNDSELRQVLQALYGEERTFTPVCDGPHLESYLHDDIEGAGRVLVSVLDSEDALHGLRGALSEMAKAGRFELHLLCGSLSSPLEILLEGEPPAELTRVAVSDVEGGRIRHRSYLRSSEASFEEALHLRDIHPERSRRLELWRLDGFDIERLDSGDSDDSDDGPRLIAFRIAARTNPRDERIIVFGEIQRVPRLTDEPLTRLSRRADADIRAQRELDFLFAESLRVIREAQARRKSNERYFLNRIVLHVHEPIEVKPQGLRAVARRLEGATRGHGLQKVVVRARVLRDQNVSSRVFSFATRGRHRLEVREDEPSSAPIRPATDYQIRVERARRLGQVYPYETLRALLGTAGADAAMAPHPDLARPGANFVEYDFDSDGHFAPVDRAPGQNRAGVVIGLLTHPTRKFPDGIARVFVASDPTMAMGALSEPECARILAAISLAEEMRVPIEWLPVSSGAKIAMDSGTENLDWTARVLRRLIAFTQDGGEVNIIVSGVNVGAQSYWNAEATMLMHTRGLLIQTPEGSMVLTGKKALEVSGSVAAEDERGIGGFERIMGRNGQAQVFARNIGDAYRILFDYYDLTYVAPGESRPRRWPTADIDDRSILESPYEDVDGSRATIGMLFSEVTNPGRKKPFAIREVMKAVHDVDAVCLERFSAMEGAETAVVWETHVGGFPVSLIGFESRNLPRRDKAPLDGPERWTGGTLFPQSSKKVARAINAASGNRPVVVLANLSGFDGSPESMRRLQLEYGAEIGRAVVNFKGPIIFVVIGRYHGGAYVVFSKALNPNLVAFAVEGAFASVIGGAPAAAVVFPREVRARAMKDPKVVKIRRELESGTFSEGTRGVLENQLEEALSDAILEHQARLAQEFDKIHSVDRAVAVGSLDAVIPPSRLRGAVIEVLSRTSY
jgi:acetyl/propionyl-CoA carboxylase alpha subunit/acetyl-CoA carboxylase carboxyltransferase component